MLRIGSMAPMYSFLTANNEPVGISKDHRSFYDIMKRLKAMFKLDIDLTELKEKGETESHGLQETLERIASSNPRAKELIEQAREEFKFTPFEEHVELAPELDKELDDIIKNMPDHPDDP